MFDLTILKNRMAGKWILNVSCSYNKILMLHMNSVLFYKPFSTNNCNSKSKQQPETQTKKNYHKFHIKLIRSDVKLLITYIQSENIKYTQPASI